MLRCQEDGEMMRYSRYSSRHYKRHCCVFTEFNTAARAGATMQMLAEIRREVKCRRIGSVSLMGFASCIGMPLVGTTTANTTPSRFHAAMLKSSPPPALPLLRFSILQISALSGDMSCARVSRHRSMEHKFTLDEERYIVYRQFARDGEDYRALMTTTFL